jgi:hypothetical protein
VRSGTMIPLSSFSQKRSVWVDTLECLLTSWMVNVFAGATMALVHRDEPLAVRS